jgi:hypothetical protein
MDRFMIEKSIKQSFNKQKKNVSYFKLEEKNG